MKRKKNFYIRLLSLFTVVLMLSATVMLRDGKIFGHQLQPQQAATAKTAIGDTLTLLPDGGMIVNTKLLAKDVSGYGGPVPLRIHISKEGIIQQIEALPNAETPDFFNQAKALFANWQGKRIEDALKEKVDGVSGATFSSKAIKENIRRGLIFAQRRTSSIEASSTTATDWTVGSIAALAVALLGAIIPLCTKNRSWHYVQLTLNVIVLGLWTGTFVSYALLMRLFANEPSTATLAGLAAPLILVTVAFIYPLAGKSGYYCANICPLGSAQELTGKIAKSHHIKMSPRVFTWLTLFRNILWGVLMTCMLTGTWTAWMDYELFTAFLYTSASIWVVVAAVAFLVLSIFIPRPYCHFVCPTGMLIRI